MGKEEGPQHHLHAPVFDRFDQITVGIPAGQQGFPLFRNITCENDNRDIGVLLFNGLQKLPAVDLWHHQIGEDDIYRGFENQFQGLPGSVDARDPVSILSDQIGYALTDGFVIVYDQNMKGAWFWDDKLFIRISHMGKKD